MGNTPSRGMPASEFLEKRNKLLAVLAEIDAAITAVLQGRRSNRAVSEARKLFEQRHIVVDALSDFGVDAESHPAVWSG